MNYQERELLIKKILYQSCNRGCKETDIIIGGFAKKHVNNMNDDDLMSFLEIIHLPDADIYDWYTKKKSVPEEKISKLLLEILQFSPN